ncbi:MAG: hypothetical protein EBU01_07730 [Crocinitomicaceae bacterium]|nr:hypothetical protein [Crocinitomicaceae bacterium]NCA21645.1 hypothetical protein [Crocinitomicaceae bacterium]
MYIPEKYLKGLSSKTRKKRVKEIRKRSQKHWRDPSAYRPFQTDKGVKTRKSSYTSRFHKKYPNAGTLEEIADATKIPLEILQEVYDRGMAAWRTGHRPGASQHAWGMARVHSFVVHGKTYRTADKDLAQKVLKS